MLQAADQPISTFFSCHHRCLQQHKTLPGSRGADLPIATLGRLIFRSRHSSFAKHQVNKPTCVAAEDAGADFIVANMVAEAASGAKTPKEAAERAQKRAERYYKV